MSTVVTTKNETYWFCLVLLVEVFGLSVALGGPWLEVLYFLAIVISQTIAGAYVWARLRKDELQLPIPELLAMGFAIGSSSAAISQLFLRDLLGIRLMLSPYVPIIAVATWLLVRRSPKLDVEITHTDSTTLLWLLFPAPLAIGFYVWEIYIFFVVPLLFCLFFRSLRRSRIKALIAISLTSLVFGLMFRFIQNFPAAVLMLGGVDEIFDESLAIGFSNWGISENIGLSGGTFNYYKLSHLWLGPILEATYSPAMAVTMTVVTLSVCAFIGMAIWTLTYRINNQAWVCGLGSIFVFVSKSSPESIDLPLRPAQTVSFLFFLTGIHAIKARWQERFYEYFTLAATLFVIFATRVQYGIIAAFAYILLLSHQMLFGEKTIFEWCIGFASTVVPIFLCYAIFFSNQNAPTVSNDSFEFAETTWRLLAQLGVLLLIQIMHFKYWSRKDLWVFLVQIAAILLSFALPNGVITVEPLLVASLMIFISIAPSLRFLILKFEFAHLVIFASMAFGLGFAIRIFYDVYKWTEIQNLNPSLKFLYIITSSSQTSGLLACAAGVLLAIGLKGATTVGKDIKLSNIVLVVLFGLSVGIGSATTIRPIINALRYDWDLTASIESSSQQSWYTNPSKREALSKLRSLSDVDDIFASNTSNLVNYRDVAPVISGIIHRRAHIEGQYVGMERFAKPTNLQARRLIASMNFCEKPSKSSLKVLYESGVKWFVVDLERTELRDWEPWAKTRFINDKVAILELATDIVG